MKRQIKLLRFLMIVSVLALLTSLVWAQNVTYYEVKPGDTLAGIANQHYNDPYKWTLIYRANRDLIGDADLLKPGWKLTIPRAEEAAYVKPTEKRNILKIVTGDDYPPFTDRKLPEDGMITEIVTLIFKEMGYDVDIEFWGWNPGLDATYEGSFAATFPYGKDPKREKKFYFSKPLYEVLRLWYVKNDATIKYTKPEDLNGLSFCKAEGYSLADVQELLDKGTIRLQTVKDVQDCFELLQKGEVDLVPLNELVGWSIINKYFDKSNFRTLDEPVGTRKLSLMVSKKYPEGDVLIYKFNQALNKLNQEKILQQIKTRHLEYYLSKH